VGRYGETRSAYWILVGKHYEERTFQMCRLENDIRTDFTETGYEDMNLNEPACRSIQCWML
jgi:hypothetical protein